MAEKFISDGSKWSTEGFSKSDYALNFNSYESPDILNSPNLSLFPLLAYHKICNDHYRNEKWQPFQPWTCNIDYVNPSDNMNAKSFVNITSFTWLMSSIIDLENANLPIDYFTSVLPRAQYGEESAVPVGITDSKAALRLSDPSDSSVGVMFGGSSYNANDTLRKDNTAPTSFDGSYVSKVSTTSTGLTLVGLHGNLS